MEHTWRWFVLGGILSLSTVGCRGDQAGAPGPTGGDSATSSPSASSPSASSPIAGTPISGGASLSGGGAAAAAGTESGPGGTAPADGSGGVSATSGAAGSQAGGAPQGGVPADGATAGAGGSGAPTDSTAGGSGSDTRPAGTSGGDSGGGRPSAQGGSGGDSGGAGASSQGGVGGTGGATSPAQGGSAGADVSICSEMPAADPATIYVIGDSTASIYASDLYPRTGWAQVFDEWFSPACATVKDKAISGRSSKSFYDEGAWTPIAEALAPGDWVLIQFGHNDEKDDDPARYTDPQTTFKDYLTTYIDDTRAKQAFPLLLTPINRNKWSGAALSDTHGAYPDAMRELAQALDVPLVDATALTKEYFERIGEDATTALFMNLAPGESPNYPDGNSDNTHLKESGARVVAQMIAADLYRQDLPIAGFLSEIPEAP